MPKYLHHTKFRKEIKVEFKHIYLVIKIAFISIILFFFTKNKPLLWIIAFEFLDIWRNILQRCMPQLPVNIEFIFGVLLSYFFHPAYGLIIFMLAMVNKIVFFAVNYKHFVKGFRYILLFFVLPYLRFLEFYYAAMIVITLNYILKYVMKLFIGAVEAEDTFYDVINFILSSGVFYLIHMLAYYLPILF